MLLVSTSSFKWYWLHKIFILVKKSSYDWIDLVIDEKNYDTLDEKYLKWLVDSFWVSVLSITAPERWLTKKKIDRIAKIAQALWAQVINFCPPHIRDKNVWWYFKYLLKIKRDLHLSIALKNVEQKFMFFLIPEYKSNTFSELKKITWDTALDISSIDKTTWIDLLKALSLLGNSVVNVFLNDRVWQKLYLLPGNAWWWVSHMPIESFLMKLKTTWYNFFFTLKVSPKELWVWDDEKVLFNLEKVKTYYEKHFVNYK